MGSILTSTGWVVVDETTRRGKSTVQLSNRGVRSYGQQFQTATAPTFDGRTWHVGLVSECPFVAVRLVIRNVEAAGYTLDGAAVAASDGIVSLTPTGSWANVTFAGSGSVAVPARLAAGRPSTVLSDWIPLQSIPRADGSSLPALHFRAYIATGPFSVSGANTILGDALPSNNIAQFSGRFVSSAFKSGGNFATTNQAGFTSPTLTNLSPCLEVEFLTLGDVMTVAGLGDSIMFGVGGVAPLAGAGAQACALMSSVQKPVFWMNASVPATTTAQFLQRLIDMLAAGARPHALIYAAFSPNDGTPDASNIAAARARLAIVLQLCDQNGIVPIITTGCPNTAAAWDATADNFRKAYNAEILALQGNGVIVADWDAVLTDGATPARYAVGMTTDGTHPNADGHAAMMRRLLPALAAALPEA